MGKKLLNGTFSVASDCVEVGDFSNFTVSVPDCFYSFVSPGCEKYLMQRYRALCRRKIEKSGNDEANFQREYQGTQRYYYKYLL
jgi:hypothetical protein